MNRDVKIFSSRKSKSLAEKICKQYDGGGLDELKLARFADNEFKIDIRTSCRGSDSFVISACNSSAESIWEMMMIADSLKRASSHKNIAIFAYLPYSRSDRKTSAREPISAKLLADCLQTAGYDRLVTIDLHASQIEGFYNIPVVHLSASYLFVPYIKQLNLKNMILCSPDAGSVKNVKKYSDIFGVDMAICHKHRPNPNEIGEMKLIGNVKGKDVVIIDDLVDTAGTLSSASILIKEMGANSVRAAITHPVMSGDAYNNIKKSELVELITTDTIPLKDDEDLSKITVLSVDKMLADVIKRINQNKSVSSDFYL